MAISKPDKRAIIQAVRSLKTYREKLAKCIAQPNQYDAEEAFAQFLDGAVTDLANKLKEGKPINKAEVLTLVTQAERFLPPDRRKDRQGRCALAVPHPGR